MTVGACGRAFLAIVVAGALACGGGKDPRDLRFEDDPDAADGLDGEVGPTADAADGDTREPVPGPTLTESAECHPDQDRDGFAVRGDAPVARDALGRCPAGTAPLRFILGGDLPDCDDGNPEVHPARPEGCNGRDDNCDGLTDDVIGPECFEGCVGFARACSAGTWQPCPTPATCCEGAVRDAVRCLPSWWVVLVDSSWTLDESDPAGLRFLGVRRALERMDGDHARLQTFARAVTSWGDFATEPGQVAGWADLASGVGNGNSRDLDGALLQAMELFPPEAIRRLVLVVTDGRDEADGWNPHEVRVRAIETGTRIAAVGLGDGVDATLAALVGRPGDQAVAATSGEIAQVLVDLFSRLSASQWSECRDGAWSDRTGVCGPPSRDCLPENGDPAALEGMPCDDGDPCTLADTCRGLACVGATPLCDDGNPCTRDECDPVAVACRFTALPAASPCPDDGNACTRNVCDGAGTCTHPPAQAGTTCPGGTSCIQARCNDAAVCVFDLFVRRGQPCPDDGNPCTQDRCDGVEGTCLHETLPQDGQPCEDGDLCTEGDACRDGACTPGPRLQCPTICMACQPLTGDCVAFADGTPCSDGDLCTADDACRKGACAGQVKRCDDQNPCTLDACLPGNGSCGYDPGPRNGLPCDDGFPCTGPDLCGDGVCAGTSMTCPVYADVKPVLQQKCGACHAGPSECSGRSCFAGAYPGPGTPATACPGATLDRCIFLRARNGSMPPNAVCTGDPAQDEGKPACLTAEEFKMLDDWAGGGGLP